MSTDTERVDEGAETSSSLLETWADWYHLPIIGAVMLFMFWVRTQAYDRFVTNDGTPALSGVDSWYHWRTIQWTSENYPRTNPYEVWTGFPTGNQVGQFGTLFDQLIVTVAMIVGLGDPSTETLYAVALLSIPAMAALVAIPVFYMGRRLGGTVGGVVSILVLALAPGSFLSRSTVGQLDHHVGEVLFMAIAVLPMMVALRAAEREQPIYELVVDRDRDALREPAIYSVLAGLALSLYIWVWPSAVVLIGIFGVFFAVQLCLDYLRGISPDHVAFVGAVSLSVTAIVSIILIEDPGFGVSSFGFLQPLTAILVAAGCVFMAWLARVWNARDLERRYYPAAIAGIAAAGLLFTWLALPDLYSTLIGNLTGRLLPLNPSTGALTISEAQPPDDFAEHVRDEFGMAFYTMLAGLVLLVVRPYFDREFRAEYTLIIVWSLFTISMAATQTRFAYYLVLSVAVVNAVFVADVVRLFNLDIRGGIDSLRQIETYQIIVLLLVVVLLFAPLLPPMAADDTAWERGESTGPHSEAMVWEEANHWVADNTPEPGNWGDAENADELDYYGTYNPGDGDYDYPEGAYGVMSWWDYGHLITTQAKRIPHSNPFQQHARSSSAFLTAESEERGELILDAIAAGESPTEETNEELEAMAEDASHEEIRYVMIDHSMAGGKFNAITQWTGPDYGHYMTPSGHEAGQPITGDELAANADNLSYGDTMLSKLYFDDGDGMEHYRTVHENEESGSVLFATYAYVYDDALLSQVSAEQQENLQEHGYSSGDVLYFDENGEFTEPGEGDPAIYTQRSSPSQLQQYQQSPIIELLDANQASTVKTFERVEGATLTGTVDDESDLLADNATVTVDVELETNAGRTFTYTQEAELADGGSFEVTVPYATNDELGVEDGYTNSSVEATGAYNVSVGEPGEEGYQAQTDVAETAVVQGENITVDGFERTELEDPTEDDENEELDDIVDGDDGDGNGDENGNTTNESENATENSTENASGNDTNNTNDTAAEDGADTEDD